MLLRDQSDGNKKARRHACVGLNLACLQARFSRIYPDFPDAENPRARKLRLQSTSQIGAVLQE